MLEKCDQLLEQIPKPFNLEDITRKHASSDSPLVVVLIQEITRYNQLLNTVRDSLILVKKGMQGLVVISPELEQVCQALYNGKVPNMWKQWYPSLKTLSTWTRDLCLRIKQLQDWSYSGRPKVFWLSGFTFPTGFLTALLQSMARRQGVAIDHLSWEFNVINNPDDLNGETIQMNPKEGAYIKGMYLEGAGWDFNDGCLCDPAPMKLYTQMPVIHFKPIERKHSKKGLYSAPVYLYPIRTGTRENPSFVCYVDLKCGNSAKNKPSLWAKRGTALLLALAD